ncbi:hypothetical protein SLEP1_g41104 [Rubroshorea leprosula]|uniref:Uncharacterized protein n=1 Tax=Rubroshorea leprosula TaxID=152421 RepID=A0AAV5L620_9ROSI|nr:hypothetical protein SLEP1_g41104 [Rubroshorea leprosula]
MVVAYRKFKGICTHNRQEQQPDRADPDAFLQGEDFKAPILFLNKKRREKSKLLTDFSQGKAAIGGWALFGAGEEKEEEQNREMAGEEGRKNTRSLSKFLLF